MKGPDPCLRVRVSCRWFHVIPHSDATDCRSRRRRLLSLIDLERGDRTNRAHYVLTDLP